MSGMFPDNQSIELFGEQVLWPGVDENGKFTNGSFANPLEKPSFIPAETINLILNNLEEFIKKCNGTPNSTTSMQLADLIATQSQANKIIQRDVQGRAKVAAPAEADDIARKYEVDIHANATAAIHGAANAATANRLVIRDANGRAQVAAPAFDDDSLLIAPTKWVRENFNPRTIGDLVSFAYIPSAAELIRMRVLPLEGQVIPISQYQALFSVVWSSAAQGTGDWWYKCTSNGTRDNEGNYFRVLDHQGLFPRAAGKNSKYKMANDAPYDGMAIGAIIEDAIRNIKGYMSLASQGAHGFYGFTDDNSALYPSAYGLPEDRYSFAVGTWPYGNSNQISIDASRVVPTALENRPASISAYLCIKY